MRLKNFNVEYEEGEEIEGSEKMENVAPPTTDPECRRRKNLKDICSRVPFTKKSNSTSGGDSDRVQRVSNRLHQEGELKMNFFGPFVFLHGEPHVVDQYAKVVFPFFYGSFLIVYFLFHYLHADTLGGRND